MWLLGWNMEVTSPLGANTIIYDINPVPEGCVSSLRHTVRSWASQSSCLSFALFFKSLLWSFYRIRRRGRALWIISTAAQWQSPTYILPRQCLWGRRNKTWRERANGMGENLIHLRPWELTAVSSSMRTPADGRKGGRESGWGDWWIISKWWRLLKTYSVSFVT